MSRLFKMASILAIGGTYLLCPTKKQPLESPAYEILTKSSYETHPNEHYLSKVPETIGVIGGGISGAVLAKTFKEQGYKVTVFEKNSGPGGIWHKNYDNSGLQLPYHLFPDFALPEFEDTLLLSDIVKQYTIKYMDYFKVNENFEYNTEVSSVKELEDETWEINLANGTTRYFDFLIISTGPFNKPFIPDFKDFEKFKGTFIHSSKFINAEEKCKNKKVVVIGGRKSALDIAGSAYEYGADCSIIMRRSHWLLPQNFSICGIPLSYLVSSRFAGNFLYPFYTDKDFWFYKYCEPLIKLYWKFITYKMLKGLPKVLWPQGEYSKEKHFIVSARNMKTYDYIALGKIKAVHGEVERLTENGVVVNEEIIEADTIISATGFEIDMKKFGISDCWMYRNTIIPGKKNLAVAGLVNTYGNVLYTNIEAVWLAEVLRGNVCLPSMESMNSDVKNRKEYNLEIIWEKEVAAISWFPYPMIDELLDDMNVKKHRKPTKLQNWIEPPTPADYKDLITHRI